MQHREELVSLLCVPNRSHISVYTNCPTPGDAAGTAIVDFILNHSSTP